MTDLSRISLCLLLFLLAQNLHAQESGTEDPEDEEETYDTRDKEPGYLGLGGGYAGMYSFSTGINDIARDYGFEGAVNNTLLHGGTVYFGQEHFRIAYYTVGNSGMLSKTVAVNDRMYERSFRFDRDIKAAQIGYPIKIGDPFIWIFPEIMIGGIGHKLQIDQRLKGGSSDTLTGQEDLQYFLQSSHTSFFLQPSLSVEYGIIPYTLILRAGGGYGISLGGEWKGDSGNILGDAPEIDGNFNMYVGASLDLALLILLFSIPWGRDY